MSEQRDYMRPVRDAADYLGGLIADGDASPDDARAAFVEFAGAILDATRAECGPAS